MPTKTTEMLQELLLEDPDFDVRPGIEAVPTNPLVEEEPETGGYTPPVETLQDTVAGRTTSQDFDETTRRFNSQVTWKNHVIRDESPPHTRSRTRSESPSRIPHEV